MKAEAVCVMIASSQHGWDTQMKTGKINVNILIGVLVAAAVVVGIVSIVKLDVAGNRGSGLGKEFKYDIAKLAKVNQSTVSRVLNGSANVKKATAQKVRRACRKLGYVPNIPARTLRTKQAGAVAVHLPLGRELALTDPFALLFLGGIHEQANERDFSVILNCTATGKQHHGPLVHDQGRGLAFDLIGIGLEVVDLPAERQGLPEVTVGHEVALCR